MAIDSSYLEYDLGWMRRVTGVRVRGRVSVGQWVSAYKILYFREGVWVVVQDDSSGNDMVCRRLIHVNCMSQFFYLCRIVDLLMNV